MAPRGAQHNVVPAADAQVQRRGQRNLRKARAGVPPGRLGAQDLSGGGERAVRLQADGRHRTSGAGKAGAQPTSLESRVAPGVMEYALSL